MECITFSLTSTKYYFFNAHYSFPLTPSFQKAASPLRPKNTVVWSYDIQSGKVRSWHSFTEFCGIEYAAMAFFPLGSSWWNLQPAGFCFWSAHRFGVLTAFHHCACVSSLWRMRKAWHFFTFMSSPCGLNEGQIQAEFLDCENDTLTNISSHQLRFFRVFL